MKINRALLNFILYFAVVVGMWLLYSPLNQDAGNSPKSNTQFVYANF